MGSYSDYLENKLINHFLMVASYTAPTNLYVALCKSTIAEDDTGSTLPTEVTGGSYARKSVATWDTSTAGASANSQPITFAQATADWGVVTDFAICDHSSTGQCLAFGKLNTTKNIQSGDTAKFATGDLDVTLN